MTVLVQYVHNSCRGVSCTSVELSSKRRRRCCCVSCLCWIMCSCSSSNMAGLRRADMQKYGRSSCWISAVFLTLAAGLIAQTDAGDVLTVTDANWTLILQGEWMIKLWVQYVWSDHELQDSCVNHQINSAAIRWRFDLPRSATIYTETMYRNNNNNSVWFAVTCVLCYNRKCSQISIFCCNNIYKCTQIVSNRHVIQ